MTPFKPCPFCGSTYAELLRMSSDTFDAGHCAHVVCGKCGAHGPDIYSERGRHEAEAEAGRQWNMRARG